MSEIIFGSTYHKRDSPISHVFSYPIYMLKLPTEKLPEIDKSSLFFGYNRTRIFSIYDNDHLPRNTGSISEKARMQVKELSEMLEPDSISLVTIPRFLQKVFKPVSFYLAYDKAKNLISLLAEVTNTYGETHLYSMLPEKNTNCSKTDKNIVRFSTKKNFHVSPFFKEDGHYEFKVEETDNKLAIHIHYKCEAGNTFYANFIGRKRTFTFFNALRILVFWPFTAALTMPRILWQAGKLHFLKKLPVFSKPPATHPDTIRQMPMSAFHKKVMRSISKLCSGLDKGKLSIHLTTGEHCELGANNEAPHGVIQIHNNWFFRSILLGGEIGFGESYVNQEWSSPDLPAVIAYMIYNQDQIEATFSGSFFRHLFDKLLHLRHANTMKQSKKNISEHYDLGNAFYKLFLDETMTYSGGIFESETEPLEAAQARKVAQLIEPLNLSENDHVLEIGSGWGVVAISIAKTYGAKVTTITLSEEQFRYVTALIKAENCAHLVTVKLQDYRTVTGSFDAIVSVEMIEAVGDAYLKMYFKVVNKNLKSGGRFALQAITFPDNKYDAYKKDTDFIRKHIFPGGHLPSTGVIDTIIKADTNLIEIQRQNIAKGYATTLKKWRDAFLSKTDDLIQMGYSESFIKKWDYYFAYCQAAFETGYLGTYQYIFEKE